MRTVFLSLMLALCACASPQYNYVPNAIELSEPPLGQVVTVSVGEVMLRQGMYIETDAIYIEAPFDVGAISGYKFTTGFYIQVGEDEKSTYHAPEASLEGGRVSTWGLADPYQAMQVMKKDKKICGVSIFGGKACETDVNFRWTKRPTVQANSFQSSLIYSGKIGDKINIGYREFTNNFARPAFNNDVEYDLAESNTIAYKGAVVEVLEATNRHIKYRVISNFNKAQF